MKVSKLEGAELDYWVARASGMPDHKPGTWTDQWGCIYSPSTEWRHGGPLIEQFMISISWHGPCAPRSWSARTANTGRTEIVHSEGPTALIAAMRALVIGKFGEEVGIDSPAEGG